MMSMVSPTTPHTPRSRLTLDLSELPASNNNSSPPVSPNSYTTYSGLPSPTLSGSWSQSRSQAELTALLKDAYIRIREKERDLTLAAEIGKSLLENNNDLKAKYEALIVQFDDFQKQRQQNSKFTIQAADKTNVTRLAPPNGSLETFEEEPSDYEDDESDNESAAGLGASLHAHISRSRSPSRVPMYKDYEDYRELEMKNAELQAKLDNLITEAQEIDRLHKAKQRKLEAELAALQDTYQSATQKIEDLQKENERLLQRLRNSFWESRKEKNSGNDNLIEELATKVQELDIQNAGIERAKAEIERRLQRTLQDLEVFRSQCNTLEEKTREYANLQIAYHKQTELVNELSVTLEEQRMINQGLQRRSRAGSFSENGFMQRLSDAADHAALARPLTSKRSLLEEFESEWISNIKRDMNWGGDDSPQFSPVASEGDLREFLLKNGVQPDYDDDVSAIDYMSEDEFEFLEEFDEEDEIAMRRREWFWKRWIRAVYRFFRWIWRWIEFLFLLCAAVVLALYRGPDHLLPGDL